MHTVDPLKSTIKTRHGGGLRVISTDMANGPHGRDPCLKRTVHTRRDTRAQITIILS